MTCIFIYNPNSGRGKIEKKLSYIVKKLKTKYEKVDVYATKAKGDLTQKVREVADKYDCVVFSGGDGSFNEVLRGIGDMEKFTASLPELFVFSGQNGVQFLYIANQT